MFERLRELLYSTIANIKARCSSMFMQGESNLPANDATNELAHAIAAAVRTQGSEDGAVLMVVQPGEKNSYDQQVRSGDLESNLILEFKLRRAEY